MLVVESSCLDFPKGRGITVDDINPALPIIILFNKEYTRISIV